jgi:hypothetical protein
LATTHPSSLPKENGFYFCNIEIICGRTRENKKKEDH